MWYDVQVREVIIMHWKWTIMDPESGEVYAIADREATYEWEDRLLALWYRGYPMEFIGAPEGFHPGLDGLVY